MIKLTVTEVFILPGRKQKLTEVQNMPQIRQPWNPNTGIGIQAVRLQGFCSSPLLSTSDSSPSHPPAPPGLISGLKVNSRSFSFGLTPLGQLKECPGSQFFYIKMGSVLHLQGCDG